MLLRRPKATSLVRGSRFDADYRGAAASAFPAAGRCLVNRLRAQARRRLVGAVPERRVHSFDGVVQATVVGTVAGIAGNGSVVEVRRGEASAGDGRRGDGDRPAVSHATHPFVLRDATGEIRVCIPPGGYVAFGGGEVTGVVAHGGEVSVTGHVAHGRDRERRRSLTGPWLVTHVGDT